ncbi:uncharacterized protein LOC117124147 [Anneissia japonica]|uniref:uncharacterized protein LOC117124147 n=1 Tax=Anneissia japonica TaxID=1529436 RepID=UPI0014259448|nr:uncharacterized protein LOC117124147 [Anneissia japonica]
MDTFLWKICLVLAVCSLTASGCNPSQKIQIHPQSQYCDSQFVIRAKILKTTALYDYILRHCIEMDTPTTADDMWSKLDESGNSFLDSRAKSCPLSKKYIRKFLDNLQELGINIEETIDEQETIEEDPLLSSIVTTEEEDEDGNVRKESGAKLLDRIFSKFDKYGKSGPSVHLARIIYIYKGNDLLSTSKLVEIFSTDYVFDENSIYVLSGHIDSDSVPDSKYGNLIRSKMFEGRLNVLNEHWVVKYPEMTRQQFRGLKGIYESNCNCKVYECESSKECNHRKNKKKKNKKNKKNKNKKSIESATNATQTDHNITTQCQWVPSLNTCAYYFGSCVYTEGEGCAWKRARAYKQCERMFEGVEPMGLAYYDQGQ